MESTSDLSGDEIKRETGEGIVHRQRVGADPTEGWRRGTRGELRKSCDTCTASKTKCCGDIPCDRCKKRGLQCKFSKRRRCGPKARTADEKEDKRPRTGTFQDGDRDSGEASNGSNYAHNQYRERSPPSPGPAPTQYSPAGVTSAPTTASLPFSSGTPQHGVHHRMDSPMPPVPGSQSHGTVGVFSAPLTTDGLSGLVELIAPTLSDGGGSGSSGISAHNGTSAFVSARSDGSVSRIARGSASRGISEVSVLSSFLDENSPSSTGNALPTAASNGMGMDVHGGCTGAATATSAITVPAARHQLGSARDSPASLTSFITGSSASKVPSGEVLQRVHGVGVSTTGIGASKATTGARSSSSAARYGAVCGGFSGGTQSVGDWPETDPPGGEGVSSQPAAIVRGSLPMDPLPPRAKSHLSTFLRTVGYLLPLPGTESLQEAMEQWAGDADLGGDEMDSLSTSAGAFSAAVNLGRRRTRQYSRSGRGADDPMDHDDEAHGGKAGARKYSYAPPKHKPGGGGGMKENFGRTRGSSQGGDGGSGNVDLDEACRAEAWAAVAVGALFSGAGEAEAREYASRSLRAMSSCLDAPLPEVASVFLLHALFWLINSMDKRKVARFFGIAQQVGVELGALMPEELRHSIAFFSVIVSMTIDSDQVSALGIQVRDPASWGVSSRLRPGGSQLAGLAATTVACSTLLKEQDGLAPQPFGAVNKAMVPKSLPSQALTDVLTTAAEPFRSVGMRDSKQHTDHLLAILSGLKGYTHARRGEKDEAEASARLTLEAFGRDPDMARLPLTQTIIDAAKLVLENGSGRFGPNDGDGGGGRSWSSFGQELLRAAGNDLTGGDDSTAKRNTNNAARGASAARRRSAPVGVPPRSGSMSPPPGRTAGVVLSRAELASRAWKPSGGTSDANGKSSEAILLSPESPSRPSHHSHPSTVNRASSLPAPLPGSASPRWPLPTAVSSPTIVTCPNPANTVNTDDWVERVRTLPSRSPSPAIVHRRSAGGRSPSIPEHGTAGRVEVGAARGGTRTGASNSPGLTLGPMPEGTPLPRARYASEPAGLALLSGVAAPGTSYQPRGFMSHEQIKTEKDGVSGRSGGRAGGVDHYGGTPAAAAAAAAAGELADDPPPSAPLIMSAQSFDPNHEDTSLHDMLFHNRE